MPENHTSNLQEIRDHDLLIRLDQKVDSMTNAIQRIEDNTVKRLLTLENDHVTRKEYDDHETRMRFIEKYVWGVIAILALINFIGISGIVYLISHLH